MRAKRIIFTGFDENEYKGIYVGCKRGFHTVVYTVYSPKLNGPVTAILDKKEFKNRVRFVKA